MSDEEERCFNVCCRRQLLLLLHQENVDKDVERVRCVSFGRSINFKVLACIQSAHAGVEVIFNKVKFDFDTSVDRTLGLRLG